MKTKEKRTNFVLKDQNFDNDDDDTNRANDVVGEFVEKMNECEDADPELTMLLNDNFFNLI